MNLSYRFAPPAGTPGLVIVVVTISSTGLHFVHLTEQSRYAFVTGFLRGGQNLARRSPCVHDLCCPDCLLHHLRETPRTIRVSLKASRRTDAMCIAIRSLRDPARTSKRRSDLVSNESAETTDSEQWHLFPRSRRGCLGYPSEQCVNRA